MHLRASLWIALLWILLLRVVLLWVVPSAALASPSFQRLTTRDGLSSSFVNSILQDRQGFLWFGTNDGLNRYDGYECRVFRYHPEASDGIGGSFVGELCEDGAGALWIQLGAGGIDRYDPAKECFAHFTLAAPREKAAAVRRVFANRDHVWIESSAGLFRVDASAPDSAAPVEAEIVDDPGAWVADQAGVAWRGTADGVIARADGPRLRTVDRLAKPITGIAADQSGGIWIATRGAGLWRREVDAAARHIQGPGGDLVGVVVDERTQVWCVGANGVLWRLDANGVLLAQTQLGDVGSTRSRLYVLEAMPGGGVVLGSSNGLIFVDDQGVRRERHDARESSSLGADRVPALAWDRMGGLWVATWGAGVSHLDPHRVRFQSERGWCSADDPATAQVSALLTTSDGSLWIGTPTGLVRQAGAPSRDSWAIRDQSVISLASAASGGFWIGVNDGLLRTSDGRRFMRFCRTSTPVSCLLEQADGSVLAGTNRGLLEFDRTGRELRSFHSDPSDTTSLPSELISSLCRDADGVIWVGTLVGGLSRFDRGAGTFRNFLFRPGAVDGLTNKSIQSITVASDGALWLGTYSGGVNRFDPISGRVRAWTERDGLAGDKVNALLEDASGCFWLSTNRGLSRLDPSTGQVTNYYGDDGLQGEEFLPRSACAGSGDELLFGGVNGLTRFHPAEIRRNPVPPPVVLTACRLFDRVVPIASLCGPDGAVRLSPRDDFIAFEFAALGFESTPHGRYAYQLLGFDREWIQCGERRYAAYTNLDPGRYVFRVKAANRDGVWSEEGPALTIQVRPSFWRAPWFLVCATVAVLGLSIAAHHRRVQSRVRRLLAEERLRGEEREKVRAEVSRDYHDDVGVQLTRISLYAELARREMNGSPAGNAALYVTKIAASAATMIEHTRDFLWTLDPSKARLCDLAAYLEDAGRAIFVDGTPRFVVQPPPASCQERRLDPSSKREIALLFKEALHNAWKHAGATRVCLRLSCEGRRLEIELSDDGRGFDSTLWTAGHGLSNMRARAKSSTGDLHIDARPGQGTIIRWSGEVLSPEPGMASERPPAYASSTAISGGHE